MKRMFFLRSQKKILIDHHIEPDVDEFEYIFSTVDTSSTAELVYSFMDLSGDKDLIDKQISECLYAGIVTDTGSYTHAGPEIGVASTKAENISSGNFIIFYNNRFFRKFFKNFW